MKQLASCDTDIERILRLEEMFVTDPQQWVGYLMRERAQTDYEYSLSVQLKEAQEQGLRQGMQQAKKEMARSLLANGLPLEIVLKTTGLTMEEIEEKAQLGT